MLRGPPRSKSTDTRCPYTTLLRSWEPNDGLRRRATISRAIRAPNIFEACRPSEGQTTNVEDPCAETNLGDNPNRAANCAALGRPDGFTPLNGGVGVPFIVSGNENPSPEVSDSWTAGIVLTPNFLPGLQISAAWFNIQIDDAIRSEDRRVGKACGSTCRTRRSPDNSKKT